QGLPCLLPVEPVEVDGILDHPVPAPELAQHVAPEAGAKVRRVLPGFARVLARNRAVETLGDRFVTVEQGLDGHRWRHPGPSVDARRRSQRGRVAHSLAKQGGFLFRDLAGRGLAHGRAATDPPAWS